MYALSGAAEASSVEVPLAVEIDPLEYSLTRSACDATGRRARRPVCLAYQSQGVAMLYTAKVISVLLRLSKSYFLTQLSLPSLAPSTHINNSLDLGLALAWSLVRAVR